MSEVNEMSTVFKFDGVRYAQQPAAKGGRKNLGIVRECLEAAIKELGWKPGDRFEGSVIAKVLADSGLDTRWQLSNTPGDTHGLARAVGDLLGGHGMQLQRPEGTRGIYIVPNELPVVKNDCMTKPAVYNG
jgi:hypothetical protein